MERGACCPLNPGPLPLGAEERTAEIERRVDVVCGQIKGIAPYGPEQPETYPIEEMTAESVESIMGCKPWELSEDEFQLLASNQDRYACFITINQARYKMILDGILSGEALHINHEAIELLEFRNVQDINDAFFSVYGAYLFEPAQESEQPEETPKEIETQLFLF